MTTAEVVSMEASVMPRVEKTLAEVPVISSDDELPEGKIAKGRRPDHDSLPTEVQELWDSNAKRYQKIVLLFNELKAMAAMQPCDRYEKLHVLDITEKKYRDNLAKYDSFVASTSPMGDVAPDSGDVSTDNEKTINAARKTLSKYRKILSELSEDDPKKDVIIGKIQSAVSAIIACGAGFAPDTQAELSQLDIKFD